jgi:hypothetical protein
MPVTIPVRVVQKATSEYGRCERPLQVSGGNRSENGGRNVNDPAKRASVEV